MGYSLEDFNNFLEWVLDHICSKKQDLQLFNTKIDECILPYVLTCLIHRGDIQQKAVADVSGLTIIYTCTKPK